MIYNIYSVYDRATRRFSQPMTFESSDACTRQIRVAAASDPTIAQCPEDFRVCLLATYDSASGAIIPALMAEVYEVKDLLGGDCNEV